MLGAVNSNTNTSAAANSQVPPASATTASNADLDRTQVESVHAVSDSSSGSEEKPTLIIDGDETIWDTGDKTGGKIDEEACKKINHEVITISKDNAENKLGYDQKYVLRPGTKELLEYFKARGYKMILCTRNYKEYAQSIVATNPILKANFDGVLGRSDLLSATNKDFTAFPKHCDHLGFWERCKHGLYRFFVGYPKYYGLKFLSLFTGAKVSPDVVSLGRGTLGKYPPNALAMLNETKLAGAPTARFLIDNQVYYHTDPQDPYNTSKFKYYGREFEDSCASKDFAVVSPNVIDKPGDEPREFRAHLAEPKDSEGRYLWVKNVIECVERGYRAQYKLATGQEMEI